MVAINEYNLADARLLNQKTTGVIIWRPQFTAVVLGSSNKSSEALHLNAINKDRIPIYRRPSGGEAVVITANTIGIASLMQQSGIRDPLKYFKLINQKIIDLLWRMGVYGLICRGISDIALGDKKILGSAIYQNKNLIFYQAVLNFSEVPSAISKYLKHPPREPDYRQGRSHKEFITSLKANGLKESIQNVMDHLRSGWDEFTGASWLEKQEYPG